MSEYATFTWPSGGPIESEEEPEVSPMGDNVHPLFKLLSEHTKQTSRIEMDGLAMPIKQTEHLLKQVSIGSNGKLNCNCYLLLVIATYHARMWEMLTNEDRVHIIRISEELLRKVNERNVSPPTENAVRASLKATGWMTY